MGSIPSGLVITVWSITACTCDGSFHAEIRHTSKGKMRWARGKPQGNRSPYHIASAGQSLGAKQTEGLRVGDFGQVTQTSFLYFYNWRERVLDLHTEPVQSLAHSEQSQKRVVFSQIGDKCPYPGEAAKTQAAPALKALSGVRQMFRRNLLGLWLSPTTLNLWPLHSPSSVRAFVSWTRDWQHVLVFMKPMPPWNLASDNWVSSKKTITDAQGQVPWERPVTPSLRQFHIP